MSRSTKPKGLSKVDLAAAFEVSLPTIDSWLRKGCPYTRKGGHGRPWEFRLSDVIKWREKAAGESAQEWKGGHLRSSRQIGDVPELIQQRPDFENPLRFFSEEAVKHFLYTFWQGDFARAASGFLKEKGITTVQNIEIMQFFGYMSFRALNDWVGTDVFNETFKKHDLNLDEFWNSISGQSVVTNPPPDPDDVIEWQVPDWMLMSAEEYVGRNQLTEK